VPISTIVASLDDSSVLALVCVKSAQDVIKDLQAGVYVRCEGDFGEIYVAPSAVRYVQEGRQRLPASSAPGSLSQSEHHAYISPTLG
jgi:hypothetical protein